MPFFNNGYQTCLKSLYDTSVRHCSLFMHSCTLRFYVMGNYTVLKCCDTGIALCHFTFKVIPKCRIVFLLFTTSFLYSLVTVVYTPFTFVIFYIQGVAYTVVCIIGMIMKSYLRKQISLS